ncbi:MAG: hypothetical protein ACO3CH_08440, partial [Ilumatobacteraceae bacterium]
VATTYLASPTFGIGVNLAGIKDLSDQCKSVVITKSRESLDASSFGSTARNYVGGLTNVTVTATLLMEYSATPGTYVDLTALVGTNVYVAVKPTSAAISTTNPEFQITGGYLESLDVVNAALGELSEVEITITGGTLVEDTTP